MTYDQFRAAAEAYADREFALPADCIDESWLRPAFEAGQRPAETIEALAEKHRLGRRRDFTFESAVRVMASVAPKETELFVDGLRRAGLVPNR